MKTVKFLMVMLCAVCIFSCSNDSEDDFVVAEEIEDPDGGDGQATINYTDDIAPIMSAACTGCHGSPPTNGAPFALINFSQVSQRANGILNRMSLSSGAPGAMPPSGRLPQSTIDTIMEWIDAGKPEN